MLLREISFLLSVLVPALRSQFLPSNINYGLDAFTTTNDNLCDEQLLEFYISLMTGELWALKRRITKFCKLLKFANVTFQLSIRGESYNREFSTEISSTWVEGKNAWLFVERMKTNQTASKFVESTA